MKIEYTSRTEPRGMRGIYGSRRWSKTLAVLTSSLIIGLGIAGTAWPASIQGLGFLPGETESQATATSADGSVVVGFGVAASGPQAFRWTATGGMVGLGFLPGDSQSQALSVSADGSVVVGYSYSGAPADDIQAFRWTQAEGMVGLGVLPGDTWSSASDISADGTVVVGGSTAASGQSQAFRWTQAEGMVGLGYLPGSANSGAFGVSADGSVIVGMGFYADYHSEAFRWTASGGMTSLGFLPGYEDSVASAVSADGSAVVGTAHNGSISQALRWTEAGGMLGLRLTGSEAYGVSADGALVVGRIGGDVFIWDQIHGMRWLEQVLRSQNVSLDAWPQGLNVSFPTNLPYPHLISADGQTIVGSAVNLKGDREAWVARGPFFVPHIESNPSPGFIEEGRAVTLTLVEETNPPYQWYKDDVPLIDNPPRVTGTDTQVLTFDLVEMGDAGTYHVTYDDGAKAPAQTQPFVMDVLPAGTLPVAGGLGLALIAGVCALVGLRRLRRSTRIHDRLVKGTNRCVS